MRCFVAIPFTPLLEPLLHAAGELRELGKAFRTSAPENLHMTLQFLGETSAEQLPRVMEVIRQAARRTQPCRVPVRGVGVFPSVQRPTVVWAGCDLEESHPLRGIATSLAAGLTPLGYEPETRAWRPHITLARVRARPPAALGTFMKKHEDQHFGDLHVRQIDLMLSELTPHGPQYAVHDSVTLESEM